MKKTLLFLLMAMLCGCASHYHPLNPRSDYFQTSKDYSGLEMGYKMGVLRERGNMKYAKREDLKAIRLVSVKLVNNTTSALRVGKDFRFYFGNSEVALLSPALIHKELKQGVPIYLLYLLLTPMQLTVTKSDGTVSSTPIGLFIGPSIAFGNMMRAGTANQNFLKELLQYDMIYKTINAGETVYGLIGIRDTGYNPLEIRFADESVSK